MIPLSFRLMYKCQQLIIQNDPTDYRPRNYKFVDTYTYDGNGAMILTDSDVVPESADDPDFFECLREGRISAGIRVPTTAAMGMEQTVTVYESGRLLNYNPTLAKIDEVLNSIAERLPEMSPDDPYRFGVEAQRKLFSCYREKGTDPAHRIECLELAIR